MRRTDFEKEQMLSSRANLCGKTATVIAKAFRGELVPENPNDQPASALLERINAEREGAPMPGRWKAKSRRTGGSTG
jgi:type I restriction enzyme S subunit